MGMLKKTVLAVFPPNTKRGALVKKIATKAGLAKPFVYNQHYQVWMDSAEKAKFLNPVTYNKIDTPLFSIIIPMYNTKDKYLVPLIESIVNQSFTSWELILADGSTKEERKDAIKNIAKTDTRIKYIKLLKNEGISENTNRGVEQAQGEYVIFSDHDDTLSPYALNELAAVITKDPSVEIIYSDEDKITDDGRYRFWPHFKPDWSPHQFLTCNYTNHISAVKRELVTKVKGLRTEFNGAQDYDFLLRIHALKGKRNVAHVPKVLYHWRTAEGSTAGDFSVKEYALRAGENALQEFLDSKKLNATASAIKGRPGFYEPFIQPQKGQRVLVVLGKEADDLTSEMLQVKYESLTDTSLFGKVEFVTESQFKKKPAALKADDVIVIIRENILPDTSDWLARLAGALEMDDISFASPRIVSHDGRIWDMGLIRNAKGEYDPLFKGLKVNDDTVYGHTEWIRDVDALNSRFFACRFKDYAKDSKIIEPTKDTYAVIWSPVSAIFYHYIKERQGQYNENIHVGKDGTKTVIW